MVISETVVHHAYSSDQRNRDGHNAGNQVERHRRTIRELEYGEEHLGAASGLRYTYVIAEPVIIATSVTTLLSDLDMPSCYSRKSLGS